MTDHNETQREPQEADQSAAEVLQRRVASLLNAVGRGLTGTLAPYDLIPVEFDLLRFCRTGANAPLPK